MSSTVCLLSWCTRAVCKMDGCQRSEISHAYTIEQGFLLCHVLEDKSVATGYTAEA